MDWCADVIQNPTRKPGVAIALRGSEGTGKTLVGAILRRLLGPRNVWINSDKDRLLGRFNSALAGKILIQAEETFFAGDARTTDALKHLITGQTLEIEMKYGRCEIESFHRLLVTSNHTQVPDQYHHSVTPFDESHFQTAEFWGGAHATVLDYVTDFSPAGLQYTRAPRTSC